MSLRIFASTLIVAALGAVLLAPACAESPLILATQYDQSCAHDDDCVGVFQGTITCCSGCPNAAINKKDIGKYLADFDDLKPSCSASDACGLDCAFTEAFCATGRCKVRIGSICDVDPTACSGTSSGGAGGSTSTTSSTGP
jgi:hypothetical protein